MKKSLQLKISLAGIKPLIWRRVVVNNDLTLAEFSQVINCVMPWYDCHLHQFIIKDKYLVMPFEDSEDESIEEYNSSNISNLLSEKGDFIKYEYDMGDSWMHNITVEKVLPYMEDRRAMFVTGKNMCPPEDCGGIYGYAELLKILSDPKHAQYKEMAEWLGLEEDEEFDPTYLGGEIEDIDDELFAVIR